MSYKTIGESLYAMGHVNTIWIDQNNIGKKVIGTFNPSAPWDGKLTHDYPGAFERRYGFGSWIRKGDLVGERMSPDLVESVARRSDNPLNLENHSSYVLTPQDLTDVKMVKSPHGSRMSVYDSFFVPNAGVKPEPEPPVEPPIVKPPVIPKPVEPPTQPPVTPPTPQYEYLSYWLNTPTAQAFQILKTNAAYFRSNKHTLAHTANVIIRRLTECWRSIKSDLSR